MFSIHNSQQLKPNPRVGKKRVGPELLTFSCGEGHFFILINRFLPTLLLRYFLKINNSIKLLIFNWMKSDVVYFIGYYIIEYINFLRKKIKTYNIHSF